MEQSLEHFENLGCEFRDKWKKTVDGALLLQLNVPRLRTDAFNKASGKPCIDASLSPV